MHPESGSVLPAGYSVAVVGLGLMGGSLAAALRRDQPQVRVLGVARREEAVAEALRSDLIHDGGLTLSAILPAADLTVLATPVRTILGQLPEAASLLPPHGVLTDLGSTKQAITTAMERGPRPERCLAGHPMCGKERHGLCAADADLFRGTSWILCPGRTTSPEAVRAVGSLARSVGARALIMDAAEHDAIVARTSHLPYLVSAALSRAVAKGVADGDLPALSAGGYRDTTRLAAGDVPMMLDILMTNREPILAAIREMQGEFGRLEAALAQSDEHALAAYLETARRSRRVG